MIKKKCGNCNTLSKLEVETINDNIDGGIELIKILFKELNSDNMVIESLVNANIILLKYFDFFASINTTPHI